MTLPNLLGIEIGGTKLQLGLGHGDGRLLALERFVVDPQAGAAGIQSQIEAAIEPLCARIGWLATSIAAAAVGFGGPVDAARGIVTRSMQISGWENFPLADWLSARLHGSSVALQNDADTAGLAEARLGAGRGLSPVLYVTVGSGIGGGLIIDGQIYRGAGAGALEIGHLWVDRALSAAGSEPVQLEDIASGWGIAQAMREALAGVVRANERLAWLAQWAHGHSDEITGALVAKAAAAGDACALDVVARARTSLAWALAHAVTLVAPRCLILGGGVSLMPAQLWLEPLRRELAKWVFPPLLDGFDVVNAALGEDVVVHGALALARDLAGV
jgi:glucokinase